MYTMIFVIALAVAGAVCLWGITKPLASDWVQKRHSCVLETALKFIIVGVLWGVLYVLTIQYGIARFAGFSYDEIRQCAKLHVCSSWNVVLVVNVIQISAILLAVGTMTFIIRHYSRRIMPGVGENILRDTIKMEDE